jgi:hypothetical protein
MKPLPTIDKTHHRRKIHYVDETLQKFLLVGLVVLEAGLAGCLAWLMFLRLDRIVEDNLYRVHLADATPILSQLMHEAFVLLGIFGAMNLFALVLVDLFWRRYVYLILRLFKLLMDKTCQLDFTEDPQISDSHLVLDLAETQRDLDRTRLSKIREQISLLDSGMLEAKDIQGMNVVMKALDELLPRPA